MKDQASRLRQLMTGKVVQPVAVFPVETPSRPARVIAVTSGKGGVGKTMLTVNLALMLAETGAKVLIVDADLGLANVDVMLGMGQGRHVGHLLINDCPPDEVAADGPNGIKVISGGSGLQQLADADDADRALLLGKLRAYYRHFDYVLVDTSPGIGAEVADFVRDADEVLVVTSTEPTSLRDTYAALKMLHVERESRGGVTTVVNSANAKQAEQAVQALNQVLLKFVDIQVERWHHIDTDPMVARTIRERRPIAKSYPRSPAAVCIRRLMKDIQARERSAVRPPEREVEYAL